MCKMLDSFSEKCTSIFVWLEGCGGDSHLGSHLADTMLYGLYEGGMTLINQIVIWGKNMVGMTDGGKAPKR